MQLRRSPGRLTQASLKRSVTPTKQDAIVMYGKVFMSENIKISLGQPVLIFIYSLVLLLVGCAIGRHWYQTRASAIWIAVAAAALMVMHDMLTGLLFASLTFRRFQREQRNQSQH